MRRRKFVASGLGLMAAAAGQGFVGSFNGMGLRAQPAVTPAAPRNPAGPPQGKWIRLAPFPQATGELLGAAINGKLYAAQGLLPGFKPAGLVYEYDSAGDAWTQKKPMPHPVHHAAVTALNGKMYLFGGFDLPATGPPGWNPVNDAWEYDPPTDGWRAIAAMPTPRGGGVDLGGRRIIKKNSGGGAGGRGGRAGPPRPPPNRRPGERGEEGAVPRHKRAREPIPPP